MLEVKIHGNEEKMHGKKVKVKDLLIESAESTGIIIFDMEWFI